MGTANFYSHENGIFVIREDTYEEAEKFLKEEYEEDEVAEEMRRCDSFVLASEHETFGVVYIEALACGKPVIGTYNGGDEDIIKDYNGIIVEKNKICMDNLL